VRIIGIDTTVFKVAGKKLTVVSLTDLIRGKPIEIEIMENKKARTLKEKISKSSTRFGSRSYSYR